MNDRQLSFSDLPPDNRPVLARDTGYTPPPDTKTALTEALSEAQAQVVSWVSIVEMLEHAIASGNAEWQEEALATFEGNNPYSTPEPF